jgi:hypothetical protein
MAHVLILLVVGVGDGRPQARAYIMAADALLVFAVSVPGSLVIVPRTRSLLRVADG